MFCKVDKVFPDSTNYKTFFTGVWHALPGWQSRMVQPRFPFRLVLCSRVTAGRQPFLCAADLASMYLSSSVSWGRCCQLHGLGAVLWRHSLAHCYARKRSSRLQVVFLSLIEHQDRLVLSPRYFFKIWSQANAGLKQMPASSSGGIKWSADLNGDPLNLQ